MFPLFSHKWISPYSLHGEQGWVLQQYQLFSCIKMLLWSPFTLREDIAIIKIISCYNDVITALCYWKGMIPTLLYLFPVQRYRQVKIFWLGASFEQLLKHLKRFLVVPLSLLHMTHGSTFSKVLGIHSQEPGLHKNSTLLCLSILNIWPIIDISQVQHNTQALVHSCFFPVACCSFWGFCASEAFVLKIPSLLGGNRECFVACGMGF